MEQKLLLKRMRDSYNTGSVFWISDNEGLALNSEIQRFLVTLKSILQSLYEKEVTAEELADFFGKEVKESEVNKMMFAWQNAFNSNNDTLFKILLVAKINPSLLYQLDEDLFNLLVVVVLIVGAGESELIKALMDVFDNRNRPNYAKSKSIFAKVVKYSIDNPYVVKWVIENFVWCELYKKQIGKSMNKKIKVCSGTASIVASLCMPPYKRFFCKIKWMFYGEEKF